ncbi:N-acetylneuraminate synthase family protein [Helicobacter baculiformis]|uniref:N-acetylneuraminate synthase family protein n=1 Tax=Helicobacter baculiformis TaxID=427351 RepID=A0ABV7ZIB8_9HELI|nr:N-acetylneuraminate synthase family protein [Helicobacter baculiformis]
MNKFMLGTREIGIEHPPLVVAEMGINHGGSLEVAKLMADAARRAGIEVLKHQTHIIDDEMSSLAKTIRPGNSSQDIYSIMKKCALSPRDERELKEYVEKLGMIFLSTPFSRAAANFLEDIGVVGFKIGSGEMNNHPLLKHIATFKKPMIISTGMHDLKAVQESVHVLGNQVPYALLHTTNLYPTPFHLVRLQAMVELAEVFPGVPVGLSDHTRNNNACKCAIALGASLVERHFSDTKDREGPDISCSMDTQEAQDLVLSAREIFLMRGGSKVAIAEEQVTRDFAFATMVATAEIKKGEVLSDRNTWVKRPGVVGIPAKDYEKTLGKVAKLDIAKDTHITLDMLEL